MNESKTYAISLIEKPINLVSNVNYIILWNWKAVLNQITYSEALSEHGISVKASNIDSNKIDQTGLFKVSVLGKELEVEVVDESA